MFSPALRNRQRVLARQAAAAAKKPRGGKARERLRADAAPWAPAPAENGAPASEYAALLAVLHENLRALSDIQSHEQRLPKKAEYARQFDAWVAGLLAADEPVQDEILVTMMIWAIDRRDWPRALELAGFVLHHGLDLPERYSRTAACFIAEEIAEAALGDAGLVPHSVLLGVMSYTAESDMPDQVRAKLHKAIGRGFAVKAEDFDPASENAPAGGKAAFVAEAVAHLRRALALDEKAGVKKDIERLDREQRKLAEEAAQ